MPAARHASGEKWTLSDFLKRAAGGALSSRERFRKLPRARKAMLIIAVGAAASVIVWPFLGSGPGGSSRAEGGSGAGSANDAGPRAAGRDDGEAESPRGALSIWESPRLIEERSRENNRRRVEQAMEQNPRIRKADIVISRAAPARRALDRAGEDSASVTLSLAPGVRELGRDEADSIRTLIECAFNVRPERVSITDNYLRSYNDAPEPRASSRLLEAEERLRLGIKEDVEEHYARVFAREEFNVSALVYLSSEQSSVEEESVDPSKSFTKPTVSTIEREEGSDPPGGEGGLLAPPPVFRRRLFKETLEETPFVSRSKTIKEIPPGSVQGVSLTALFDLEAVEKVIARDAQPGARLSGGGGDPARLRHALWHAPERDVAIAAFVAKEEEALRTFLRPLGDPQVKVLVHPFARRPAGDPAPFSPAVAALPPGPDDGSSAVTWALALLAVGLLAGATALAIRHARPLARGSASNRRQRGWKLSTASAGAMTLGEDVLRSVTRTNGAVRENPEAAASVLRFWLSQDVEDPVGGHSRS